MTKLTSRPTSRVLRALRRAGWEPRPRRPGSRHHVLIHQELPGIVCVPRHLEVRKGTLAKIIKLAGLTLKEFEELYH